MAKKTHFREELEQDQSYNRNGFQEEQNGGLRKCAADFSKIIDKKFRKLFICMGIGFFIGTIIMVVVLIVESRYFPLSAIACVLTTMGVPATVQAIPRIGGVDSIDSDDLGGALLLGIIIFVALCLVSPIYFVVKVSKLISDKSICSSIIKSDVIPPAQQNYYYKKIRKMEKRY